jgi:hypothetical protein
MKKIIALLLAFALIFIVTGCSGGQFASANTVTIPGTVNSSGSGSGTAGDITRNSTSQRVISAVYDSDDEDSGLSASDMSFISSTGNSITINDNGALDYSGYYKITGGFLFAAGSSGMAQAPDTSSTQYSVLLNLASSQSPGTLVHIETEDGEEVLTFVPEKTYQSVVLSSPDLEKGLTCLVYYGGSSTGTATDGLYSGGIYSAGTQNTSFTISSMVTTVGTPARGGFPGDGRR